MKGFSKDSPIPEFEAMEPALAVFNIARHPLVALQSQESQTVKGSFSVLLNLLVIEMDLSGLVRI